MTVHFQFISKTIALTSVIAIAQFASAQVYPFGTWTYNNSQQATTNIAGYGNVVMSVNTPNTAILDMDIRFDNVSFTPTTVDSATAENVIYNQDWGLKIDMSSIANTSGLLIGVGNFGFGNSQYPGYRLQAFDSSNTAINLSTLTVIGSYDHTWVAGGPNVSFNDNVSLNTVTGDFVATVTPGANDGNADMLFLSMPTGVAYLKVNTILPGGGDRINVVAAAVPEPGTIAAFAGLCGFAIRRRAKKSATR